MNNGTCYAARSFLIERSIPLTFSIKIVKIFLLIFLFKVLNAILMTQFETSKTKFRQTYLSNHEVYYKF